jgi:hypothetical protein
MLISPSTDGVLNVEMARVVAQGSGRIHGIDSSPAMIAAAQKAAESAALADRCTFEGTTALTSPRNLQAGWLI